jgi:NAD(P)-dependent dehydrogenase (short-subunit alcohol dehydrogenase family)
MEVQDRESSTWLVTGGNRGIGLAFARELARRGEHVIATARDPEKASELEKTGARVERLDVSDAASIASLAGRLGETPIDVLIHNAGRGGGASSIEKVDQGELAAFFAVNTVGPMLLTRSLLPNLERGRRRTVVGITSGLASITLSNGGWYGYRASKAALNMFHRTLAAELAPKRFTCVVLSPGWVKTDMGGPGATLSPERSVRGMLEVIDRLTPKESGGFFDYRGAEQPW